MGADFPGEAANANASAPSRVEMDNLTWTPTTDFCKNIWQISYSAIRRANNLLLNIDNITFKSEEVRKQIVGQTKFLRALAYFDLMRFYDHIVVIRETDNLNDEAPSNQAHDLTSPSTSDPPRHRTAAIDTTREPLDKPLPRALQPSW